MLAHDIQLLKDEDASSMIELTSVCYIKIFRSDFILEPSYALQRRILNIGYYIILQPAIL